ncbi:uncharacterized protein LOC133795289 [Humulus lupulus]|uniref:uncharacterized protein LOC133795289 n=1 Tax=Humulus lupulus TaxID=3486 RepID=UPI002B40B4FA|nr:uncharacterized protein LOC133795289 [Humulus lupulus]
MATRMVLKEAKAPLLLFRSSVLAAARATSPTIPSNGDLIQSLLLTKAQKPAVLSSRYPYNFDSLKVQGCDLQSAFGLHARGSKRVVDRDEDEDDDSDDVDFDVDDGDFDSQSDEDDDDDDDFDEEVVKKRR